MPKYKVMLAEFPGNNVSHMDTNYWVTQTICQLRDDPRIGKENLLHCRIADTPVTMSRNRCVIEALKEDCDYILMVDSDMRPDCDVGLVPHAKPFWPHAFNFALERRDTPCCVAAPYGGNPPNEAVYVAHYQTTETNCPDPHHHMKSVPRELAAQKSGFEKVAGLATGLILIDCRVFGGKVNGRALPGRVPPPWFEYEWVDEPYRSLKATTEDYFFTRNCHLLGYPQYVFWDAWAGHWKPKLVGRPTIITTDLVEQQFREACAKNYHSERRLVSLENGKPLCVNGR